jgi:putative ABC transport system permease protein
MRSFQELQRVNAGFDATNVLTAGLPVAPARFKDGDQAVSHFKRILEGVGSVPGVRDVAITAALPLRGWSYGMPFLIEGKPFKDRANRDACFFKMVSDGYFRALGIRFRKGRGLTERDGKGAPPVAVINETMANRFFKDEEPIGKRILVQEIVYAKPELGPEIPWEVVGVIADEKIGGLDDTRSAGMYVSYAQSTTTFMNLVVRGSVNPETLQQAIRHEVQQVDRDQPLTDFRTMEQIKTESVANNRLRTTLLGVFAGIALLLAAIGIYGVISYSVAQRTHEMGVRLALGASRGNILGLIIRNGMLLSGLGLAIGLAGAFGLTRLLTTLLFGVTPTDPVTMAGMAALLVTVALVACYFPARRATVVDPLVALREE